MDKMSNTFSFFTLLLVHLLVFLLDGHDKTLRLAVADSSNVSVYIVYLGERRHNDPKLVTDSHHDMLTNLMGSKELAKESMVYSYRHCFSGFAAKLTASQAQQLSGKNKNLKGICLVVLDERLEWPESKAFRDEGLGEIPSGWKGFCQSGDQFSAAKHCNKKLIGARWFVDGLLAEIGRSVNLTRLGTARGGAPRARLAIYKVCWKLSGGLCASADILKAFDEAIKDGVHVLTLSIAAASLPLYSEVDGRDAIAIGSFHAIARGITVVCGAGNDGPSPQTVKNTAPWIITVAASTMDRAYPTQITLGNNKTFQGQSIYTGKEEGFTGVFYPADGGPDATAGVCEGLTLSPNLVAGKVVLCFTTVSSPIVTQRAALLVRAAGGVGVIVSKPPNDITARCRSFPCAEVDYEVGTQILFYIRSARHPVVKLSPPPTLVGKAVPAKIAEFSSRGPNTVAASVLKPDIAAPGVQIIAATSALDTSAEEGFTMLSGTSMATPHIAGIVALLRALHADWSPAAIRSALTTTAWTSDPYGVPIFAEGDPHKLADPFDFGGGIANPNGAACPGLVYDMDETDYINYLCSMEYNNSAISRLTGKPVMCPKTVSILDVNLPSITIPYLRNSTTLTRTVTNVGSTNSIYHVIVEPPTGTIVLVNPLY
ncbi:UNVERIFIED_CONTAM: Subtilisin-like protease SBT3.5 [Sesamum calycinum]|uniref:Subtilisin-like protease SBT3.5 n=1 Tax=Sesamum calycinum TaxID=2727403 RepID=A0AAW2M0L0_9LAMI